MSHPVSWPMALRVGLLAGSAFALNLPFGAWRVRTRVRSLPWLLSVHLPIPFLFLIRRGMGLSAKFILIAALTAVAAQILGGRFFAPHGADRRRAER